MIDINEDIYVDGAPDSDGDICVNLKGYSEEVYFYLSKEDIEKMLSLYEKK